MQVHVKYFASIREAMGMASQTLETQAKTAGELRLDIAQRHHAQCLAPDRPVRIAVNQVMQSDSAPLTVGCEVAFFPPVTGG